MTLARRASPRTQSSCCLSRQSYDVSGRTMVHGPASQHVEQHINHFLTHEHVRASSCPVRWCHRRCAKTLSGRATLRERASISADLQGTRPNQTRSDQVIRARGDFLDNERTSPSAHPRRAHRCHRYFATRARSCSNQVHVPSTPTTHT
jgi:hypothetical protein